MYKRMTKTSDTFINWGLSVCLSVRSRRRHPILLLKFHNHDRVLPLNTQSWKGWHSQQKTTSGPTADAYQKLHRALALTAHEYQKIDWYQQCGQCFCYVLRVPRMGSLRLAPTLQDDITPTEKHFRVNSCVSKAELIASTDGTQIPTNRLVPTVWSMFLFRSQNSKDGVLRILRLAPTLQSLCFVAVASHNFKNVVLHNSVSFLWTCGTSTPDHDEWVDRTAL